MPEPKAKAGRAQADRRLSVAVAAAFERYAPALHRYLRSRVHEPASAADLTQEIFERFLQVPPTEPVRNTQGFLYGIASNVVSEYRYRQQHGGVDFDSEAASVAGERLENAEPDDSDRLAMRQELDLALRQLPPVHRAVFLLVKREGLSYAEVTERTGLEESTAMTYVYEARAKMKIVLMRTERVRKD